MTTSPLSAEERADRLRLVEESAISALRADRARARSLRFTDIGFDRAKWAEFAGLGWLMLRVPEQEGGLGFGLAETCAIARQMGQQLTPEPILFAALIAPLLPPGARDAVLAGGEVILPVFAALDAPAGRCGHDPVPCARGADAFLVSDGDVAWLVRAGDIAGRLRLVDTVDGGHLAFLDGAVDRGERLAVDLRPVREEAVLLLSAYLLGLSEAAFAITIDYLKDRTQFDKPIGAFQALQHRAVDLYLQLQLSRAAVTAAVDAADAGAARQERERLTSLAKARASQASGIITRAAIQLHGGIGYTDEADIGLYLRKAMVLGGLLGTERFHRTRAFTLSGLIA